VRDAVEGGRLHARTLRSLAAMSDDLACWTCGTTAVPDTRFPNIGYVRCPACDLVFAPSSSQEHLRRLYGEAYFEDYGLEGSYDADAGQRRREAQVRVRWLRAAGPPIGQLLEIGCASGWFLAEARAVGYEVVGIEPADEMAVAARRRSGAEVHAAMLEDASLDPGSFDVAVAWHVLEHLAQPRDTLAGVRTALRPGGRLLLELPNIASLRATRQGEDWYAMEPAHHVAHYSPGALDALLRASGYVPEVVESVHPGTLLGGREAFGPRGLAFQAKETLSARAWMRAPHPWKFDLLRAVARVPG
jgi:SAM-dependent methyltransferase